MASWLYAGLVLAALALLRLVGERWWPASLLLFCPRWAFLVPLPLLGLAAGLARSPGIWWTHGALAIVVAGPIMGLNLPAGLLRVPGPRGDGLGLRILSLNQHHRPRRIEALIDFIERERIDVLCFQELDRLSPLERYLSRGWFRDGTRGIASRWPIVEELGPREVAFNDPPLVRVRIRARSGVEFVVASVHLPTMRYGFSHMRRRDIRGLERVIEGRREALGNLVDALAETRGMPTLVAGDFNTPAGSSLLEPLKQGFRDGFEQAGWGFGYTWPSRLPGLRIDQVYASPVWAFRRCWVGPDVGSDHLPIIAELVLPRAGRAAPGGP